MNNNNIIIRPYIEEDAQALADIYYNTIHKINKQDYTAEQIHAWAPSASLKKTGWVNKWKKIKPLVAQIGTVIVGFVEFEPNGHVDCFYVHHQYQSQGVGSAIMRAVIQHAIQQKNPRIYAEVSITAKAFFESFGFKVVKKQTVTIRGSNLINFLMELKINLTE
jgi:putative acetyltransferase